MRCYAQETHGRVNRPVHIVAPVICPLVVVTRALFINADKSFPSLDVTDACRVFVDTCGGDRLVFTPDTDILGALGIDKSIVNPRAPASAAALEESTMLDTLQRHAVAEFFEGGGGGALLDATGLTAASPAQRLLQLEDGPAVAGSRPRLGTAGGASVGSALGGTGGGGVGGGGSAAGSRRGSERSLPGRPHDASAASASGSRAPSPVVSTTSARVRAPAAAAGSPAGSATGSALRRRGTDGPPDDASVAPGSRHSSVSGGGGGGGGGGASVAAGSRRGSDESKSGPAPPRLAAAAAAGAGAGDGALVRLGTADTGGPRPSSTRGPSRGDAAGTTRLALPLLGGGGPSAALSRSVVGRGPPRMVTGNEPHLLQIEFRDADRRQYMRVRIPSLPGVMGAEAVESYVSQQPILPIEVLGGSWGHLTDPLKRYSAPVRLSTFDLTSLDLIWFRGKNRLLFCFSM